ncbi:hypothetical protein C1645_575993 [Glomus cerebriforme]|uniref:Zn(2)-C6 fungal-type domain-containing protein n=1 Tax=Glomus cerebriforme TaxID=658196 RepID=A0A397S3T3_9GLOM|nr:hypothetical protein C1645_575993 [Glomus cerebriforme]
MATTYLRPLANAKRVKLVSTCDVCKNRKVRCDKERPECGTCRKTNRKCSYTYATLTETMRDKQSGMRTQAESQNLFQSELNYLQEIQFGRLYNESGYLAMASRGFGIDVNESQHVPGMLATPMIPITTANVYDGPYDSSYYLNNDNFLAKVVPQIPEQNYLPQTPQTSIPPQQFQLSPQQSPHQQMPQPPPPHQPPQQQHHHQQSIKQRRQALGEDAVMEDLITNIKNMNLYESTRYIGEGSLLMLDEENGEMIIPQMTKDISEVDDSLKYLPNQETVIQLIRLYYKHVHRYFPAIREQVVWNALGDLSKPQHLLLLNCIFFIASPFHNDPDKQDGKIYFGRAEGEYKFFKGLFLTL